MKLLPLNQNIIPLFQDMDPYSVLGQKLPPKTTAIGAFITGSRGGNFEPAALTIITDAENSLIIQWLYVENEKRGMGVGDDVLYEIFKMALQLGKTKVKAHFFNLFGRNNICCGEELYFRGHGFAREWGENPSNYYYAADVADVLNDTSSGTLSFESLAAKKETVDFYDTLCPGPECVCKLSQLKGKTVFQESIGLKQVTPIAEEDMMTFSRQLQTCRNAKCTGLLKELDENLDLTDLDLDLSCVIYLKKELECILLVARPDENTILPIIFRSLSEEYNRKLTLLLQYAMRAAWEKYEPDTNVILRVPDARQKAAVEKLLGLELK